MTMTLRTIICLSFVIMLTALFNPIVKAEGTPIKVLIYSGSNNHDWQKTTPEIERILKDAAGFSVDMTEHPENVTAAMLSRYDVIVSNWNNFNEPDLQWPKPAREAFEEFIRSGKGHVTIHAGGSSFNDWQEYHKIAAYWDTQTSHGPVHEFTVKTSKEHPITVGVKPFQTVDELWNSPGLPPESIVLMTAYSAKSANQKRGSGKDEPVLTVNSFGQGRCVNLLLGHNTAAMRNSGFETLLVRSVQWAAGQVISSKVDKTINDNSKPRQNKYL